jgi:hypothetical protein
MPVQVSYRKCVKKTGVGRKVLIRVNFPSSPQSLLQVIDSSLFYFSFSTLEYSAAVASVLLINSTEREVFVYRQAKWRLRLRIILWFLEGIIVVRRCVRSFHGLIPSLLPLEVGRMGREEGE